jgi:hypothetical protein
MQGDNWAHIKLTLGIMDRITNDLDEDLDQITLKTLSRGRVRHSRLYHDRYNSVLVEEAIINITSSYTGRRRFISAISNKAQSMQSKVLGLEKNLKRLKRFSDYRLETGDETGNLPGQTRLRIGGLSPRMEDACKQMLRNSTKLGCPLA